MASSLEDPLMGFRFRVSIPGLDATTGFQKISGFQADVDVFEWEEMSDPVTIWKMPTIIKFGDIVFERGVTTGGSYLWTWYTEIANGMLDSRAFRKTVSVRILRKGLPEDALKMLNLNLLGGGFGRTIKIYNAFPSSMKLGDLDASSSLVQIESLTLVNEGIKVF